MSYIFTMKKGTGSSMSSRIFLFTVFNILLAYIGLFTGDNGISHVTLPRSPS